MLNREDVRKVIQAYTIVLTNIAEDGDSKKEHTMREMQELVLVEVINQEAIEKESRKK